MSALAYKFPDLVKEALGGEIKDQLQERINTEEMPDDGDFAVAKLGVEVMHTFLDVLGDMNEVSKIDLRSNVQDLALMEFSSESAGCNKTIQMALMSFPYKMLKDQLAGMGIIKGGEG